MDIGLNILDNLRISIGEDTSDVVRELEENNIDYSIPYSSESRMVLFIESFGVELSTKNNKIVYIKSSNSDLNYIMHIGASNPSSTLIEIRDKLATNFNVDKDRIRIDRFEASSFKSIMSIPYNDIGKVRISLVLGVNKGIYIETMQLLVKT